MTQQKTNLDHTPASTHTKDKIILSYSALSAYLRCPKAYQLRYLQELAPLERSANLRFGSVIHDCLERWHRGDSLDAVLAFINETYPAPRLDEFVRRDWHLARAMLKGYARQFPTERFRVLALEKEFLVPLVNPATGRASRKLMLAGKVDGLVQQDGQVWLLEHKTASVVDGDYLERLPMDLQVHLYALCAERAWGFQVAGVLYNPLLKIQLKQAQGETEGEFEERRAALRAKSKTGKTSAKRQMPESDEDFHERLLARYQDPGVFMRQEVFICRSRLRELAREVWDLGQDILRARREDRFLRNTESCYRKDRRCAYVPLCRSGECPLVRENFFRREAPHQELTLCGSSPALRDLNETPELIEPPLASTSAA